MDDETRLLTDDWSSDWGQSYEDELHFYNNIQSLKTPPDAEHFVSDHFLARHVATKPGEQTLVEIEFEMPREIAFLVTDVDIGNLEEISPNDMVIFKVAKGKKLEPVLQKEADELSKEDIKQHQGKVDKSILKELASWIDLGTLQKRLRKGCTNSMTARWVIR